jgi:signal transduction histidine kinase
MQNVDSCATSDVPQQTDTFPRSFNWWGPGWLLVAAIFLFLIDYSILHGRPYLLHDWRSGVVIVLSLFTIGIYIIVATRQKTKTWPPPLLPSLAAFAGMYGAVVALALIDANFAYDFYIVLGIIFSRFASRLLLPLTTILVISILALGHAVTFPFSFDQLAGVLGISLSFYTPAISAIVIQNMIDERFKRNRLLAELTQAHEELAEAHQKLADSAAQEQELAVLRERNRLAREMHDTLGHALVLVTVKLEVAQRLRERDPERSNQELEVTQTIVRESMNELRASIANLRSPALEHEPACRALSRAAREMAQRTGITVTYDLQPDIEGLPEQVEETLWKVGQEAIANIEKHAHASNVLLSIRRCDSHVLLRLEDNGVGLPFDSCQHKADGRTVYASPEGHYGLNGMVERIERVGGTFRLQPGAEHGVIVEVELPLVEAPARNITE